MRRSHPAIRINGRILASQFLLLIFLVSSPSWAHHSFSMYDSSKTVTLRGTVKSFEWANPHIVLWVYAEQSGQSPELWTLELSSPANVRPEGWTRRSLQAGDKVVIEFAPLRDGTHGGWLRKVTTAGGSVLTNKSIVGVVRSALPERPSAPPGR